MAHKGLNLFDECGARCVYVLLRHSNIMAHKGLNLFDECGARCVYLPRHTSSSFLKCTYLAPTQIHRGSQLK